MLGEFAGIRPLHAAPPLAAVIAIPLAQPLHACVDVVRGGDGRLGVRCVAAELSGAPRLRRLRLRHPDSRRLLPGVLESPAFLGRLPTLAADGILPIPGAARPANDRSGVGWVRRRLADDPRDDGAQSGCAQVQRAIAAAWRGSGRQADRLRGGRREDFAARVQAEPDQVRVCCRGTPIVCS